MEMMKILSIILIGWAVIVSCQLNNDSQENQVDTDEFTEETSVPRFRLVKKSEIHEGNKKYNEDVTDGQTKAIFARIENDTLYQLNIWNGTSHSLYVNEEEMDIHGNQGLVSKLRKEAALFSKE